MLLRSNSLRLMSVLVALAAAGGCDSAEGSDEGLGGSPEQGGSGPYGQSDAVGYEETAGDPGSPSNGGAGALDTTCDVGVRFEMAPNATHARVSAAFAVAALEAGTWPNINRSLLRHEEFLAYFARSDSDAPFARVRTGNGDEGAKLDVFVSVPPSGDATHLILVVDTSTSMRNDLPLAGEIVSGLGAAMAGGDQLTIVEWGSEPRIFTSATGSTVPASQAGQLGADFDAYALELTKAQLGPGGSLGPAQVAVDGAIAAAESTPHIVVLTDGGVEADGDAFAAIESWATKRSAVISFIEIAGGSDDEPAQPRSFHREQLASMAVAGGGLTHFVTHETLPSLVADFDGNFRIGRRAVRPRYDMPGITSLVSSPDLQFAAGELSPSVLERWSGVGRPVFTSVGVTTCGLQQFPGTVFLDEESVHVDVGAAGDPRLARLALIDQLFDIVRQDCEGAKTLIEDFDAPAADSDLSALVDKAAALCSPQP